MHAAVLTEHGHPPAYGQHPEPEFADDRVLVLVSAAPISPLDLLCASGASYFGPPAMPYVPGVQGVGSLNDGTRVWFTTSAGMAPGDGSLAEFCSVTATDVVRLGGDLHAVTDAQVASLGLSAIAAWQALTGRAQLAAGERVLVLGSSGTVGQVAVQVAKLLGAQHVTAACRSEAGARRAREQGADAVVILSRDDDVAGLAARLRQACPEGFDVVLDPLFGVPAAAAVQAMAGYGRLVHLGSSAGPESTLDSATVRSRSLSLLGYTNNSVPPEAKARTLQILLEHAARGDLSVAHQVRPLAEVGAAWHDQATGAIDERIVLAP